MNLHGFSVIYPSYIDSNKTVKMGRRLSKEESVPTPTVTDISYALQQLSIRHAVQPYKGYSRDITCQWDNPGRVLVDIPTTMVIPEGQHSTQNPKKLLLKELAQNIPLLPYRIERLKREAEEAKVREEQERKEREAARIAAQNSATAKKNAVTSNKKKNKGKKKK